MPDLGAERRKRGGGSPSPMRPSRGRGMEKEKGRRKRGRGLTGPSDRLWAKLPLHRQGASFRWDSSAAVACLRRSGPSAPKDARFGSLACLCRPLPSPRPPVNHSNSRPASFLKSGPDVVFTPGGTSALTVSPWADLDTLVYSQSAFRFLFFLFSVRECRVRACCNQFSNLDRVPGSHPLINALPDLLQLRHCTCCCYHQSPEHKRPLLSQATCPICALPNARPPPTHAPFRRLCVFFPSTASRSRRQPWNPSLMRPKRYVPTRHSTPASVPPLT